MREWKPEIQWRNPKDLTPYARNAKVHTTEQVDKIAGQIDAVGFTQPIVVDKEGVIIAGHGRREAALRLNLEAVPVVVADHLNEYEVMAARIADNKVAEAPWDLPLLAFDLGSLQLNGVDLKFTGMDLQAAEDILKEFNKDLPEQKQSVPVDGEDEVPEVPPEPKTKRGDIIILGRHRLMCGDATSADDVCALLNDGNFKPEMVYTDPPYGVSERTMRASNGRHGEAESKDFAPIIGDDTTETAVASYKICESLKIPTMVFWGANYYAGHLPHLPSWIVWDKRQGVRSDDNADCELAWCNNGKPARVFGHLWKGFIKASEHGESKVHPTQKPVALAEWVFENYGNPQSVLDLFGGSGSTLIAAEKTGRAAYIMELDPHYCDVIVERYNRFVAGKEA